MNSDFIKLIAIFKNINNIGYVKGVNNNINNAGGLTFENLINKKADSKYLPDFNKIEIKTTQRFSRYNVNLFSLKLDGPDQFESHYLLTKYGTLNYTYDKNELSIGLKLNEKVLVNDKYYFELNIDHKNKKLFINIYDINNQLLETRGHLYFDSIIKRFNIKLKYLALVFSSKKTIENNLYFRYYKIICYKCQNPELFFKLIENKTIKIALMLRFAKSGQDIGKNKNKNIVFSISRTNLSQLYEEVYSFEN